MTTKVRYAKDPTEGFLFSTIRITANYPDGSQGCGTGFFYVFAKVDGESNVPCIVTNRHVIEGAKSLDLVFRKSAPGLMGPEPGQQFNVTVEDLPRWAVLHPSEIDLCALPLAMIIHGFNSAGVLPWFGLIEEEVLVNAKPAIKLRAVETVFMVGYPIGLWDEVNDLPIVRRGITATHPGVNWRGKREFLIDAACFPGSSGSPLFLVRQGARMAPDGKALEEMWNIRLMGILYAGPQFTANGDIKVIDIPTSRSLQTQVHIPMNLGIAIKAEVLTDLDQEIRRRVSEKKLPTTRNNWVNPEPHDIPSFLMPE